MNQETEQLKAENERYKQWVNDLQAGMYVNCVYCGHRYGPENKVASSMADALKQHIEQCPEHPMSMLKAENAELKSQLTIAEKALRLACKQIDEKEECCPAVYFGPPAMPKCKIADCGTEWFSDCWNDYFMQQASKGGK